MDVKLKEGFSLDVASKLDKIEIWQVFLSAFQNDEIWYGIMKDVNDAKEIFQWVLEEFALRWDLPDIKIYKITEIATGKIVGWGSLQTPWKYLKPEMTEQMKAKANSTELPSTLKGMNIGALTELMKTLSHTTFLGYDPENDYHRRGSMIHPDFQKMKFGSFLAQYCNQISDAKGDRQWVSARPTSVRMFKNNKFVEVGSIDAHIERWGGPRERSMTYLLLHDPQTSISRPT